MGGKGLSFRLGAPETGAEGSSELPCREWPLPDNSQTQASLSPGNVTKALRDQPNVAFFNGLLRVSRLFFNRPGDRVP